MTIDTPLVIAVAPNGARKTRANHPGVPLTPKEIAETAARCLDSGASMIHLHVRDIQDRHSLDPDLYRAAIRAVTGAVGDRLVIQVTSESAGVYEPSAQIAYMKVLRPEAISVALREFLPDPSQPGEAAGFFQWLSTEGVVVQYILFSEGDLRTYEEQLRLGNIPATPHWLLFVLGRYADGFTSSPVSLLPFLADGALDKPWAVCAFGRGEHSSAACAATLGGHVRLGFENNIYLKNGQIAESNDQLITQMVEVADAIGRPVADAHTLRGMMCNV